MIKSPLAKSLLLFVLVISAFSLTTVHYEFLKEKRNIYQDTQYWFKDQPIDHFNPTDSRTFSQRYWVNTNYFTPSKGSIMLYICGEGPCSPSGSTSFVSNVAAATKSLVLTLEHRYYGLSVPFGNNSLIVDNLRYLTVEQGLEDLAYFIDWIMGNHSSVKVNPNSKWIVVGGSYSGALSAWFRLKYPHLVVGSWASSPVINAILNFDTFDYHVFIATNKSGSQCPATMKELTSYLEWNLYKNGSQWAQTFRTKYGAANLSNEEFLWFVADNLGMRVQYGGRVQLCSTLQNYTDLGELFTRLMKENFFGPQFYSHVFLNNNTWNPDTAFIKLWNYQVCTQLGWFQPPYRDSRYAMRSQYVNMSFFKLFCQQSYGRPFWPDVDAFNAAYGGENIASSNIILVNGSEDPWLWASNINSTNPNVASYTAYCDNCGHCVDMHTPNTRDHANLTLVRTKILNNVTRWFNLQGESESEVIYA